LLLRASGAIDGRKVDVEAVTENAAAAASGVTHAPTLLAFADAFVGADDEALGRARAEVRRVLGDAALVDAAAVASNFERMVRVADATGTPLDPPMVALTEGIRRSLRLDRFAAAANTPGLRGLWRIAGGVLRPLVFAGMRVAGRWRGR
jgi:hypothetical protein